VPDEPNSEQGDESSPQRPMAPLPDLPEAVHLLNSEGSDFLDLGLRRRSKVAANVALDAFFLLLFSAISYVVDYLLHLITLEGVASTTRNIMSVIFAVGTIACALQMMIADLIELGKELFRR
jgi:hypothetical protein